VIQSRAGRQVEGVWSLRLVGHGCRRLKKGYWVRGRGLEWTSVRVVSMGVLSPWRAWDGGIDVEESTG